MELWIVIINENNQVPYDGATRNMHNSYCLYSLSHLEISIILIFLILFRDILLLLLYLFCFNNFFICI